MAEIGASSGVARIWCEGGTGCAPSPEKFWNFYIKMVSSGAFWAAISYRLAASFTGIGSKCGVEI